MMISPVGSGQYDYSAPYKFGAQGVAGQQAAKAAQAPTAAQDAQGIQGTEAAGGVAGQDALKRMNEVECETCANRQYQDGSDDPSVSFQSPTHISPEAAAGAVRKHEYEHVNNEQARAEKEDREVVSQSVRLKTDICPECGKVYVAGGTTTTTTKADNEKAQAENAANQARQGLATPYKSLAVDEKT